MLHFQFFCRLIELTIRCQKLHYEKQMWVYWCSPSSYLTLGKKVNKCIFLAPEKPNCFFNVFGGAHLTLPICVGQWLLWPRCDLDGATRGESSGKQQDVQPPASIMDPRELRLLGLILAFKPRVTKCSFEGDSSFCGKIKAVAAVLAVCHAGSAKPVEISH